MLCSSGRSDRRYDLLILHIAIPEMHHNNMSSVPVFCSVVASSFSLLTTDRINLCTIRYRNVIMMHFGNGDKAT